MTPTSQEIRDARALLGITQDQAAQMLHVARRTYQDWESGKAGCPGAAWELMQIKVAIFKSTEGRTL